MFKKFQWKQYFSNALEKFGRYSSIAVAIWTIIAMLKGCVSYCSSIWLVRRITKSHRETARYAMSPSSFLIKGLGRKNNVEAKQEMQIIRDKENNEKSQLMEGLERQHTLNE